MAAIDYLTLRSTLMYTSPGVLAPVGSIFTVAASGMQTMNTTVSSIGASTITVSTLQGSTLFGSTIVANSITLSTLMVSTINGALPGTGSGSGTALTSTMVSIGASTNQTYNNSSNGSYTTWTSTKTGMSNANKTVMSANGLYQLIVANATSGLFLSSDSGITWTTLTGGLPTLTGSAYWSDGVISANGQYITLSVYGGSLWMSADYGRTFALTNQPTPSIWLPLNGNVTDSMGLSVVTTPGSVPGYATVNRPGYTTQVVNLVNTAGSGASQYIRGTWTGASNFTVSLWMNPRTLSGVQQQIVGSYLGGMYISINTSNQLFWYMPSGGGTTSITMGTTSFALSTSTWYYITIMFQSNNTCSFYVNNTLISTYINVSGLGTQSTAQFGIGCNDNSTTSAFDGYVSDLRITHSVSTYVPIPLLAPINWLPFDNSFADLGSSGIMPTVAGTITYNIPGNVGQNAAIIANNPAGGATTTNYIRGAVSIGTAVTLSGWFNFQTLPTSSGYSLVAGLGNNTNNEITVYYQDTIGLVFAYNQSGVGNAILYTLPSVSINTWYHFYYLFQASGTSYVYLNGVQVASTVTTTYVATITTFSLGANVPNTASSFNGYIDDFRIYNAAIPYHTLFPQNYKSLAISGTGQYALALAVSGWVVGSSNVSNTWSKQAVSVSIQTPSTSSLSISYTGQYQLVATGPASGTIMPNQSGLTTSTWSQGGVNWTTSSSPNSTNSYLVFNNKFTTGNAWSGESPGNYNTSGAYTGSVSTTIQGIGSVLGEWFQLQSSVPLVLTSYNYAAGTATSMPKTYYMIGSMDGSNWYPLQYTVLASQVFSANFQAATRYITMDVTGIQTFNAGNASTVTTTAYSYNTQHWMYFRMVIVTIWTSVVSSSQMGEFYPVFRNSVSYSTDYGITWLNRSSTVSNESVALSSSGQYALSTNLVTPYARLTLDNTTTDLYGNLILTTGGTVPSYPTLPKMVGANSALFTNIAGTNTPAMYLNYTVPAVLNTPPALTISCWVYPLAIPSGADTVPLGFCNGSTISGPYFYITPTSQAVFRYYSTGGDSYTATSNLSVISLNTWYHFIVTFSESSGSFYLNGVLQGTFNVWGNLSLSGGGNITNLFIGCGHTTFGGFNGNVDDVRIYTSALNADEVNALYKNPALTQTIAISKSYLPITSYTEPVLTGITANVVDTAISQTGQYMIAVTSGTSNNVYYSTDFGVTFTALSLGTSAMTSCSISYDGSYLTVENATVIYILNRNTQGYSVAVGNTAGLIGQSLNSIAIGNKAGQINQSANSIVLNATGNALDATSSGLYITPIADITSSTSASVSLLGHESNGQVVRTGISLSSTGTMIVSTLDASVDAIAQGPYLLPSIANRGIIIKWLQKTVNTVTPVAGVSPFWGNSALGQYWQITVSPTPVALGYNGGVLLPDGRVVFVPHNATVIGVFNTITNTYNTYGTTPGTAAFVGGVLLPNGNVLFVPYGTTSNNSVGMFYTATNTYATISLGVTLLSTAFSGGVLLPDGRVVFVPYNSTTGAVIGLFNPVTNAYSTAPLYPLPSSPAFGGGVLLPDGRVVFVPYNSRSIGLFDPITNTYSSVEMKPMPVSFAYRGGVLLPDGRVVFVPYNSKTIGLFDPITNAYSTVTMNPAPVNAAYGGGILLPDGNVIFVPYAANTTIGIFNSTKNTYSAVAISITPTGLSYRGGVLLPDGRVVFVPYSAGVVGIFSNNIPASRELCLHPFFNKF